MRLDSGKKHKVICDLQRNLRQKLSLFCNKPSILTVQLHSIVPRIIDNVSSRLTGGPGRSFRGAKRSQEALRVDGDAPFFLCACVRACARESLRKITFFPPEGEKHRHVFACLFSSFPLPLFFFFLHLPHPPASFVWLR